MNERLWVHFPTSASECILTLRLYMKIYTFIQLTVG